MSRILLVRHGETTDNVENRISGQSDCPLTDRGRCQAEAVARWVVEQGPDVLVTSDLSRARDTAAVTARRLGLPVETDPGIREVSMGEWEGRLLADLPPDEVGRWRAHPAANPPYGGERLDELAARGMRALRRWQGRHPAGTVVWFTHGAFIGVLLCRVLGLDLDRRSRLHTENGSVSEIRAADGGTLVWSVNETAHIRDLIRPGGGIVYLPA